MVQMSSEATHITCPISMVDFEEHSLGLYKLHCCSTAVSMDAIQQWFVQSNLCPFCRTSSIESLAGFTHTSLAKDTSKLTPHFSITAFLAEEAESAEQTVQHTTMHESESESELGDYDFSQYQDADDDDEQPRRRNLWRGRTSQGTNWYVPMMDDDDSDWADDNSDLEDCS